VLALLGTGALATGALAISRKLRAEDD
jgi:hypothetical protein